MYEGKYWMQREVRRVQLNVALRKVAFWVITENVWLISKFEENIQETLYDVLNL